MSIEQRDGKTIATSELRTHRIKSFYRDLFPLEPDSREAMLNYSKDIEVDKNNVIITKENKRMSFLLSTQIKKAKFRRYKLVSAQEIVDTYLGNHLVYKSISNIYAPVILLSVGFGEVENKRLEEILVSFIDSLIMRGTVVEIFIKIEESENKYSRLINALKERDFNIIRTKGSNTIKSKNELF